MTRGAKFATGAFIVLAGLSLMAMTGREIYWRWVQAPPQAVTGTKPDGTLDLPVMTSGYNAEGYTLAEWMKRGQANHTWIPVPQRVFSRAKGSFAITYHTCYYNKTAAKVVRTFVAEGASINLDPQGFRIPGTSSTGCVRRTFFEFLPSHVPNGDYRYRVCIHYYQNERYHDVEACLPEAPITITD